MGIWISTYRKLFFKNFNYPEINQQKFIDKGHANYMICRQFIAGLVSGQLASQPGWQGLPSVIGSHRMAGLAGGTSVNTYHSSSSTSTCPYQC